MGGVASSIDLSIGIFPMWHRHRHPGYPERYTQHSHTVLRLRLHRPASPLWANLPNLTCCAVQPTAAQQRWTRSIYQSVWSILGLKPGYVLEFFSDDADTNVFTVGVSLLKCNFEAVTLCTDHKKDLLASAVLLFIFYIILSYVCGLLGVPVLGVLFLTVCLSRRCSGTRTGWPSLVGQCFPRASWTMS